MRWFLLVAVAVTLVAVPFADASTSIRLDGAAIHPELALTSAARAQGLMGRKVVPADGMLFVFPNDTYGGFWMKDTRVPLTIVFFDSAGARVRKLAMTPCRRDPCRVYLPGRAYRFALELRASDPRAARVLGPGAELRRLARRAS